jgi:tetratricopeptide (TPR) repeat protein
MSRASKSARGRRSRPRKTSASRGKSKKTKTLRAAARRKPPREVIDPAIQQQLKQYEEAVRYFNQQKFLRAKQALEKVIAGPSRELADRARIHLRISEQRISRPPSTTPRSLEDFYHQGIAMMNLGLWDTAREHLDRARKLAPKADYVYYALAALDCLTGEADLAMENLKAAIELRPENRYHARNDEDFAFLQDDPRFTELLYPEREGFGN